jgi:NAD(P)-dependent dehydrogenase (short-subunit alcohol dehydrogenase family)
MSETTPRGAIAVTGASKGIGAAIALELAGRGYPVACLTRGGRGVEERPVPPDLSERLHPIPCDVTDEGALTRALAQAAAWGGGLRGLVNNAGLHLHGASESTDTGTLERLLRVNTIALFVACREAFPLLRERGGLIVNMGSYFDRLGVPRNTAYTASKAAVGAITRCLAVEWASRGIQVVNIAPGYIETDLNRDFLSRPSVREALLPRIPIGRPGTPAEVARLVAALFGEEIPYLTGATIYIDGGHGIAH